MAVGVTAVVTYYAQQDSGWRNTCCGLAHRLGAEKILWIEQTVLREMMPEQSHGDVLRNLHSPRLL